MNESDYKHWKTYFNSKIIGHGENLHGIGGWDEITHIKYWEFISTILGHDYAMIGKN